MVYDGLFVAVSGSLLDIDCVSYLTLKLSQEKSSLGREQSPPQSSNDDRYPKAGEIVRT